MSSAFVASYVVLWLCVLALGIMVFVLLRELGRFYLTEPSSYQRDGIGLGEELPPLTVVGRDGEWSLRDSFAGHPYTAVLITRPDCSVCPTATESVLEWSGRSSDYGAVVLVEGPALDRYGDVTSVPVGRIDEDAVKSVLRVRATPWVFLVDRDGRVAAKGIVNNEQHLAVLEQRLAANGNANSRERR